MTLARAVINKSANEPAAVKSEDESDDTFDSNESLQGSDIVKSENDSSDVEGSDIVESENDSVEVQESDIGESENDNVEESDIGKSGNDSAEEQESDIVDSENDNVEANENNESNSDEPNKESDASADETDPNINAGWVDSVAKILKTNKPKHKKTLVLSKAKKLTDVRKEKPQDPGFQIEGEIKEEKPDPLELLDKIKKDSEEPPRKKKKELVSVRVKPTVTEKDRERALAKIATRGVVQLFNAVRAQQKDIDQRLEEAGPLERNKDRVLKSIDKRQFLDVLMGGEQAKSQAIDQPVKEDPQVSDTTWGVLRDDFMLSAKFKDWDKQQDEDNDELQDL